MTGWQRPLRLALGLLALAFAGVVYFAIRERPTPPATSASVRTDPKAIAESTGGEALVAKGSRRDYKVEYARALTYDDGTLKFEKVRVEVPQRRGRDFRLSAATARVTNNQAFVEMEGAVGLRASDGLDVKSERASYDNANGMLRVPGAVAFRKGRMSGRAVGATFDRDRDVLWLLDRARIDLAPTRTAAGAEIVAGTAGWARRDRYMRFERGVTVTKPRQVVEAENAMAYLAPDEDRLETLELRGNSRVSGRAPAPGGLRAMNARDINLSYAEDGQTLRSASLAGTSVVQLAGQGLQPGRRLAAEAIDLTFGPDGSTLISLLARDRVQLDLPGEAGSPTRQIRATVLEAVGPPDRGLTTARFVEDVEFRETVPATRTAPASERIARSRTLDAAITGGFSSLDSATFSGNVGFLEGGMSAAAPDAVYDVSKGTLRLVSPPTGGAGARVDDERATVEARRIDLTLDGRGMVADADVRSLLKSSGRSAGATAQGDRRRPGMLKADQPVHVTAKHLVYDSATSRAVYTGEARLWQGETAVLAHTITIDDRRGDLLGKGQVRSTLRLDQTDAKTGKKEPRTSVVTSEDLRYEDAQRRATYTTDARMNGPEGDLRADRIELYLDAAGSALDRAEAYVDVVLRTERRNSFGDRLTYFAADERYVMSGAPVRVLEQLPQECRETIGRTLTFFRSADTISVDGNEERTQTTAGGRCPEPRSE